MPTSSPAFGLSAVPSPKKIRRMLSGFQPPIAAALARPTLAADLPAEDPASDPVAGSPLLIDAAAVTRGVPPNSRRLAAAAVHASGATAGSPLWPPAPSHDHNEPFIAAAGATRAAAITTAGAAADGAIPATTTAGTDPPEPEPGTATETETASTVTGDATSGIRTPVSAARSPGTTDDGAVTPAAATP